MAIEALCPGRRVRQRRRHRERNGQDQNGTMSDHYFTPLSLSLSLSQVQQSAGGALAAAGQAIGEAELAVRFQHSHPVAASRCANVGIKGPPANHAFLGGVLDVTLVSRTHGQLGNECQIHSTNAGRPASAAAAVGTSAGRRASVSCGTAAASRAAAGCLAAADRARATACARWPCAAR